MTSLLPSTEQSFVRLDGWAITNTTLAEAADAVASLAYGDVPSLVVTPNMSHLRRLRSDGDFRAAYKDAVARYADGMPLIWLSRMAGTPLQERIAGADLEPAVCARLSQIGGHAIYLGGKTADITQRAVANRSEEYEGLRVSGRTPSMGFTEKPREVKNLMAWVRDVTDPREATVLFVCAGAPESEKLVHRAILSGAITRGAVLCAGAAIDFAAGRKQRAPEGMRRSGFEWAHRMLSEPRRLGPRYIKDAGHLGRLAAEALAVRMFGI